MPSLFHHIFNPDSRKTGFGWWVFIVSTVLLMLGKIEADKWDDMVIMSGFLIGGGTLGDKFLGGKNGKPGPVVEASPVGASGAPGPTVPGSQG